MSSADRASFSILLPAISAAVGEYRLDPSQRVKTKIRSNGQCQMMFASRADNGHFGTFTSQHTAHESCRWEGDYKKVEVIHRASTKT